jgi:hypothetical protein
MSRVSLLIAAHALAAMGATVAPARSASTSDEATDPPSPIRRLPPIIGGGKAGRVYRGGNVPGGKRRAMAKDTPDAD